MRILFLSCWFPYPATNGSKLRIFNLLRHLAQRHEVSLLSFADVAGADPGAPPISAICRDVRVVPWKPFQPQSRTARLGLLSRTPRSVLDTFSPEMERQINTLLSETDHDLVIASQLGSAAYGRFFRGLPAVFEEIELGALHDQLAQARSPWRRCRYGLTWFKHRRYLARVLRHFRACTVVSEQERRLVLDAAPAAPRVTVIPNGLHLPDYDGVVRTEESRHLVFTGSFRYFANYDAMTWFLRKVYPRIQARLPEVLLTITGDHAGLPLPPARNVRLTGFVDDVRSLVASSCAAVVPLRIGGGTRLKILEAMALGTPVVATSKAAEGLEALNERHLLIADDPQTFADQVIRLMQDPELRARLSTGARRLVEERYDWRNIGARFEQVLEEAVKGVVCA